MARERGYGNITLTNRDREIIINQVIDDQKISLDKWIEYFLYDEESKSYEMWEKYWVFQGLQELGKFDKKTGKFSKRDKTTVYPFPPVEREYVFTTLKLMEDFIKDKKNENDIRQALSTGNFKLLYEYVIKQSLLRGERQSNGIDGKWVKYEQGSDYNVLRNSLQGFYTGWCTAAGENFARMQLEGGDFYVYYTHDDNGDAKVPRIAIRMNGKNRIGEIRGIANNQNMEPEMLSILEEKLKEFPDRDRYYKKDHDMKLLTLIDKKVSKNIELSFDELKFLYEIDDMIDGFGYKTDPRIKEIRNKRNQKKDCSLIFNLEADKIALSQDEWENNPAQYKVLVGDLTFNGQVDVKFLTLLEYITGYLSLEELTSVKGLVLPKKIGGELDLINLTSAKGLVLPETVGGDLYLSSLISTEGLTLPQKIGGVLDLSNLTSAKGLVLPETVGGDLYLSSLTSIEGLVLPKTIGGELLLNRLLSSKGLKLPYDFDLNKLKCPDYVKTGIMLHPEEHYMEASDIDEKNTIRR